MSAENLKPEVVAVISAAVAAMGGGKVIAVRVKPSKVWAMNARGGRR